MKTSKKTYLGFLFAAFIISLVLLLPAQASAKTHERHIIPVGDIPSWYGGDIMWTSGDSVLSLNGTIYTVTVYVNDKNFNNINNFDIGSGNLSTYGLSDSWEYLCVRKKGALTIAEDICIVRVHPRAPVLSQWGIIILVALILSCGIWLWRKRAIKVAA